MTTRLAYLVGINDEQREKLKEMDIEVFITFAGAFEHIEYEYIIISEYEHDKELYDPDSEFPDTEEMADENEKYYSKILNDLEIKFLIRED